MVSPVRIRVPPLPALSGIFLFKQQMGSFSNTELGSYSSLFRSFLDRVAVRVAVKTAVTGQHQDTSRYGGPELYISGGFLLRARAFIVLRLLLLRGLWLMPTLPQNLRELIAPL
jgi:hypothetical protein